MQRHGRGLALSSEGTVFLQHAKRLWAEYRDAVRHAMELRVGEAGLLRIGATGATVDSVVMPVLKRVLPRRPALRVQLVQGLSDDLNAQVESGKLDLAVTPIYADGPPTLHHEIMVEDPLCVAAGRRHPLAAKARVPLRDLAGQRWILPRPTSVARQMLDARFAEAGSVAGSGVGSGTFLRRLAEDIGRRRAAGRAAAKRAGRKRRRGGVAGVAGPAATAQHRPDLPARHDVVAADGRISPGGAGRG